MNYFKSYSSLGDDRFFLCHPVCLKLHMDHPVG